MDPKHSHGQDRIDYRETPEDLTDVHAAILREHPEPSANITPVPLWLITICGVAVTWAGAYFGIFHGGFRPDVFNALDSSARLIFPEPVKATGPGAGGPAAAGPTLAEQGKSVYANCQPCHQAAGQGLPGQFPPLAKSDWVASEKRLVAILLKGLSGPITVNGGQFNGAMPAWESTLTDKKIAAVASFVRSSFGNTLPELTEAKVAAARKEFADQKTPWTVAQLEQIPADATLPDAGGAAAAAPAAGGAAPAAPAAAAAPAAPAIDLMAIGKTNYGTICVACHQPTGMGLPMVFPPLGGSEFVKGDPKRLIAIILKGVMGPITVEGKPFNNVMPGQGMMLDDKKIAGIATYVRKSFGNNESDVTPDVVAEVRKQYASRNNSWTEAELKSFGAPAAEAAAPAGAAAPAASPAPAAAPAQ